MGRRTLLMLSCDCCGKEYEPHQEYGTTGYIAHRNICEPYNMSCFAKKFLKAKDDDERWKEVLDHLDIDPEYDNNKHRTYEFVIEAFDCMVRSLTIGLIDSDEGYVSHPDIGEFMMARRGLIKDVFNFQINKRIESIKTKSDSEIKSLEKLIIK
jgi:hypothetical protein